MTTGIYSWIRHPSTIGKLIGVISLGILMRTPGFLFVFVPFLFAYSVVTTILIQEHYCIEHFGEDYLRHKREVPMYIPKWSRAARFWKERKKPRIEGI